MPAWISRPGGASDLPRRSDPGVRSFLRQALPTFLALAAAATFAAALVYVAVQGDLRSGANDPQLQLAEDAAAALDAGAAPASLVGPAKVDLATSLASFMVVFDASGAVLASNGVLDGHDPVPPPGLLEEARLHPPDTVTWQPRAGVRIAQVSVPWRGGVVLAGRSLREVERREDQLLLVVAVMWLAGLVGLAGVSLVVARLRPAR